jgi:hypothetical protein
MKYLVLYDLMFRILSTNLQNTQPDIAPGISQLEVVCALLSAKNRNGVSVSEELFSGEQSQKAESVCEHDSANRNTARRCLNRAKTSDERKKSDTVQCISFTGRKQKLL